MTITTLHPIQIARVFISFSWIYHGLVPKIIHIAPLEQSMTAQFGFSAQISYWITKTAGIAEILFGLVFYFGYRLAILNYLNIAAMVGLVLMVGILQPMVLFEAFNPITTNGAMIGFSLLLLSQQQLDPCEQSINKTLTGRSPP